MRIFVGLCALLFCGALAGAEEKKLDVNELREQIRTGEAYNGRRPVIQKADIRINKGERCDTRYFHCTERESFWGTSNVLLGVGIYSAHIADLETTFPVVRHPSVVDSDGYIHEGVENNNFMVPFIDRGRPASYAVKMGGATAIWVLTHKLRRSDRKWVRIVGWVTPIVSSGYTAYIAKENYDIYRRLHSLR